MFRRLTDDPTVQSATVTVDGKTVVVQAGDTVAVALLLAGAQTWRTTPVTGAPRGPYCMMGVCFDCLVEIDGAANRQACMTEARDGMRVVRQSGGRPLAAEGSKP